MAERRDNIQQGSAERGAPGQNNQAFVTDGENQSRSSHDGHHRDGDSSIGQTRATLTDTDRNARITKEKITPLRTDERAFNLVVDDVPYMVKASPFKFNGETRFYVSVNDSPEHVFTWDSELKRLRAIDDNAGILPESVEVVISDKLQSKQK